MFKEIINKNKNNSAVLEIITLNNEFIINLMDNGICGIHHKSNLTYFI